MASDDPMNEPLESAGGDSDREEQPGHPAHADSPVAAGEVIGQRSWRAGGDIADNEDERDIRAEADEADETSPG